ncbi:GCN5-related N-acetyltransferase [Halorubrum saccharovorum DSM 1137]|uniref:GCN5-related N-acetyltransferase n=1 Tax=Halorubrum saccharovorum DSM 1137 TaxID=1227484 RepID=M0E5M6_9EURY|nr:GCN5-related N-acetyltransferase [Halorubrum saccharovorum DSM 1137]
MTGDAGESTPASDSASVPVVREARPADADAVAAFARDTWGQRHDDYVPRVFPEWAASDDSDSGTFVATLSPAAVAESDAVAGRDDRDPGDTLVEGDGAGAAAPGEPEAVVGCIQGVLLTEWEAWGQGIRVDPAARGAGVGTALSEAALDWARDRGAAVCRNMVFKRGWCCKHSKTHPTLPPSTILTMVASYVGYMGSVADRNTSRYIHPHIATARTPPFYLF